MSYESWLSSISKELMFCGPGAVLLDSKAIRSARLHLGSVEIFHTNHQLSEDNFFFASNLDRFIQDLNIDRLLA